MVKIEVTDNCLQVVNEVIANRFYSHLGAVMVPDVDLGVFNTEFVTRVMTQFLINADDGNVDPLLLRDYTKARLYDFDLGTEHSGGLVSSSIDGYHNVGEEFVDTIENEHLLPRHIKYGEESLPIRGLGEVAALSRVLGDNDWIGGSGGNLGYVIRENAEGRYAQVVMVDPGQSFTLEHDPDSLNRNFGISAQGNPNLVEFDLLCDEHKIEFLHTLHTLSTKTEEELKLALTTNKEHQSEVQQFIDMSVFAEQAETYIDTMTQKIQNNIAANMRIYQQDILHYGIGLVSETEVANSEIDHDATEQMSQESVARNIETSQRYKVAIEGITSHESIDEDNKATIESTSSNTHDGPGT